MTLYGETRTALNALGVRPRKRWGQHFLVDDSVFKKIIAVADIQPGDKVLEIGPGLGFPTEHLLKAGAEVWGVEIDRRLADWLHHRIRDPNFHLLLGDVLELDLPEAIGERDLKVVANLPYSISTPVISRLLERSDVFRHMVLMLQREVAERLASPPGRKSYGVLTILTQIYAEVIGEFRVPRQCFFPQPEVDSSVVTLKPFCAPAIPVGETRQLRSWVIRLFTQRRKSLRNSFAHAVPGLPAMHILSEAGIDPSRRPETLSTDEIVGLHRLIRQCDAGASRS